MSQKSLGCVRTELLLRQPEIASFPTVFETCRSDGLDAYTFNAMDADRRPSGRARHPLSSFFRRPPPPRLPYSGCDGDATPCRPLCVSTYAARSFAVTR